MQYSYFVYDNRQIFITSNSLDVMTHFLQIRSSIEKEGRISKYLEKYVALEYPEALYLKATLCGCSDEGLYEGVKKSAQLGYPTAIYRYGAYLDFGDYFPEDKIQASECFKQAAYLGHAQSEWIYGIECFYGIGVQEHDKELGLEFIERSARKKYRQALVFLEEKYREGKEIKADVRKADLFLSQLKDNDLIDLE